MSHHTDAAQPSTEASFLGLRPLLLGIAYRLLGSVMDAEDVVQDAYLHWQRQEPGTVSNPKAFLTTMVTRQCIDQLRSARHRHEHYVGLWLPEPIESDALTAEPSAQVEQAESLSFAFMVLLEHLTPLERTCFVLHDVFAYSYQEIADMVSKSAVACRQLATRGRQHMHADQQRYAPSPALGEDLTRAFMLACQGGDVATLMRLLATDVTAYADGGGQAKTALRPIQSADHVARYLVGITRKAPPDVSAVEYRELNGQPAIIIATAQQVILTVLLTIENGVIQTIWMQVNPQKLRHLTVPDPAA